MELLIESKTLYAVSYGYIPFGEDEGSLSEFCYQRVVAWGPDPEEPITSGVIYPWVVCGDGVLEPCKEAIAVIDELPPGCSEFVSSSDPCADKFNTLHHWANNRRGRRVLVLVLG